MTAPLLAVVGISMLAAGVFLLRRTGSAYRVARLLAVAPQVELAEIVALVVADPERRRYVRAHGRISSHEDFPDELNRPLVFRRRRLERADGRGGWHVLDEERLAVPFGIEDRQSYVAVDADALGDGLVVLPRESTGTAADLPPEIADPLPERLAPATPVRLRIDQVSAVEHATVCGVPERGPDGLPRLTAGLGRPLILTVVEPDAAMRLLASGRRGTVLLAGACLVAGLGLVALALVALLIGV